jgi:transcriptional/translational regulatory protein YebC/TACO1
VAWLFTRKGLLLVPRDSAGEEDALLELALEAGAEDLDSSDPEYFRISTAPEDLHTVKDFIEERGVGVEAAQFEMEPSTTIQLEGKEANQMVRLMDAFDDHDDVQNVWANFEVDDELLADA